MRKIYPIMLALSIFLASCTSPSSPAATVVVETGAPATATKTPLPTPSPTPTQIPPTASPTPTPNPFAALPELSQKYYGESNLEATNIANALQYIAGGAHPSNMCGPLAAQILQEAGIISPYIDIADFWLLNPRVQPIFLAEAFPPSRFSFIQSREPIQRYNFAANPLKAGDFLYLYAGPNGNFEHMLTVTRVDEAGRAYSVTNLNTDEGYLIDEYLLYDPNAAGEGLFYRWNDRDYEHLGLTGSGGFDLWRPNALWDAGDASLNTVLENIFITAPGGDWSILIREMDGNLLYARNEDHRVHIASVAKIHIAMLFLASIETRAGNLSEYLASRALAGRSYEQLLYAMLVNSEKEATDLLFAAIKSNGLDMDSKMLAWGLMQTSVPYRKSTPYDMALTLEGLYKHQFISEQGSQYILDLMGVYTENDDTRIGVLKEYLSDAKIYNKRGTITDEFLVIADAGIVETGGKVYIIVMLGGQDENLSVNDAELTRTLEALIRGLGQFLR